MSRKTIQNDFLYRINALLYLTDCSIKFNSGWDFYISVLIYFYIFLNFSNLINLNFRKMKINDFKEYVYENWPKFEILWNFKIIKLYNQSSQKTSHSYLYSNESSSIPIFATIRPICFLLNIAYSKVKSSFSSSIDIFPLSAKSCSSKCFRRISLCSERIALISKSSSYGVFSS